jgi:hypothetical protein
MNDIVYPFIAEIAAITYRDLTTGVNTGTSTVKLPPLPSEIAAAVIIYGAFSFIPDPRIRQLLGWGIVIATVVSPAFANAIKAGGPVNFTPGPSASTTSATTSSNGGPVV